MQPGEGCPVCSLPPDMVVRGSGEVAYLDGNARYMMKRESTGVTSSLAPGNCALRVTCGLQTILADISSLKSRSDFIENWANSLLMHSQYDSPSSRGRLPSFASHQIGEVGILFEYKELRITCIANLVSTKSGHFLDLSTIISITSDRRAEFRNSSTNSGVARAAPGEICLQSNMYIIVASREVNRTTASVMSEAIRHAADWMHTGVGGSWRGG